MWCLLYLINLKLINIYYFINIFIHNSITLILLIVDIYKKNPERIEEPKMEAIALVYFYVHVNVIIFTL